MNEYGLLQEPEAAVRAVLDPDRWVTGTTSDPQLATDDINRLRREAERILEDSQEDLSLGQLVSQLRYRIATREPLGEEEDPDIKIVTLWGAKGLTADFVYIVGLCDEALPGQFDAASTGLTEGEYLREQLRLLYVSLTRAKQALVLSRPTKIRRGLVAALGLRHSRRGSKFWQDLSQCQFISLVPPDSTPTAVAGENWAGIEL